MYKLLAGSQTKKVTSAMKSDVIRRKDPVISMIKNIVIDVI